MDRCIGHSGFDVGVDEGGFRLMQAVGIAQSSSNVLWGMMVLDGLSPVLVPARVRKGYSMGALPFRDACSRARSSSFSALW